MSYSIGPTGPTGILGPQGLQGKQGPVGKPFGFTGQNFSYNSASAKLQIYSPSSSPITLTSTYRSGFYNLYSVSGTITVNLPSNSATYPLSEQVGMFWWFKNNSGSSITLTYVGTNAPSSSTLANGDRARVFLKSVDDTTGIPTYLTI
jgi:hypothetical protein